MNSSAMMSPTTMTRQRPNPLMSASSRSSPDMAKDPACRANQIVDDRVGGEIRPRARFFGQPISGPHQHAAAADDARQFHIQPSIADNERLRRIDAELGGRAVD